MAAPLGTPLLFPARWLSGINYLFVASGDVLPIHRHGDADSHITIVSAGSFLVHGAQEGRRLSAGDVVEWKAGEDHGFEALTEGARAVNLRMAMISEIDPEFRNGGEMPLPLPSWISEAIRAHSS